MRNALGSYWRQNAVWVAAAIFTMGKIRKLQKVATPAAVTPTQSPDILTWIRQEVGQGISEAMEASNRSVKRPRQRLVSSESSVSEYQGSAEEFQVLDQIYSSENEEEVLSEYLDAKTVDKLILKLFDKVLLQVELLGSASENLPLCKFSFCLGLCLTRAATLLSSVSQRVHCLFAVIPLFKLQFPLLPDAYIHPHKSSPPPKGTLNSLNQ
ncbi:Hypothetical predicted protein [Pelobates cultripes]|uniref:Uncharacterized protein n=1 Tax=Pelobates cultripes TaxID=61616 RepID=A0AAD1SR06_PELCU|nr:Hypothetical predicted protein [Pelobates cultripes]